MCIFVFFFSSRRRHTRSDRDWSSDVCSSDLNKEYKDIKENKNLTFQEKKMFINKFKKIKVQKNNNKITNDNIIKLINIIRSEVSKNKNISEQLISNKNDTIAYLEDGLKKNSKWREKIFYKITDQLIKKKLKIKIKKNTLAF